MSPVSVISGGVCVAPGASTAGTLVRKLLGVSPGLAGGHDGPAAVSGSLADVRPLCPVAAADDELGHSALVGRHELQLAAFDIAGEEQADWRACVDLEADFTVSARVALLVASSAARRLGFRRNSRSPLGRPVGLVSIRLVEATVRVDVAFRSFFLDLGRPSAVSARAVQDAWDLLFFLFRSLVGIRSESLFDIPAGTSGFRVVFLWHTSRAILNVYSRRSFSAIAARALDNDTGVVGVVRV